MKKKLIFLFALVALSMAGFAHSPDGGVQSNASLSSDYLSNSPIEAPDGGNTLI